MKTEENEKIVLRDEDSGENRQVVINCDAGSTVTVNVSVRECHYTYGYPEWFDKDAYNALLRALHGDRFLENKNGL